MRIEKTTQKRQTRKSRKRYPILIVSRSPPSPSILSYTLSRISVTRVPWFYDGVRVSNYATDMRRFVQKSKVLAVNPVLVIFVHS
jgi:hypothetical protein